MLPLSRRENFMQSMQTYAIHWKGGFGYGAVCEVVASRGIVVTGHSTHCRATVAGRGDRSRTRAARVAEGNIPGASAHRDDHRRRHWGNGVCPRRRITGAGGVVAVAVVRGADGTVAGVVRSFRQQDRSLGCAGAAGGSVHLARVQPGNGCTLGADKGYDTKDCVRALDARSIPGCRQTTAATARSPELRRPRIARRAGVGGGGGSPGILPQGRAHAPRHHRAPRAIRSLQ